MPRGHRPASRRAVRVIGLTGRSCQWFRAPTVPPETGLGEQGTFCSTGKAKLVSNEVAAQQKVALVFHYLALFLSALYSD